MAQFQSCSLQRVSCASVFERPFQFLIASKCFEPIPQHVLLLIAAGESANLTVLRNKGVQEFDYFVDSSQVPCGAVIKPVHARDGLHTAFTRYNMRHLSPCIHARDRLHTHSYMERHTLQHTANLQSEPCQSPAVLSRRAAS